MSTTFDCGRPKTAPRADADILIPLPPPAVHAPWPPRRGGLGFELIKLDLPESPRPFDHLPGAVAAMDAGDPRPSATPARVEQARQEGFDAGMRAGAEHRSIWDVLVGACWAVGLLGAVLGATVAAGWVQIRLVGFL